MTNSFQAAEKKSNGKAGSSFKQLGQGGSTERPSDEGISCHVRNGLMQRSQESLLELQKLAEKLYFLAKQKSLSVIGFTSALAHEGVSTLATHISAMVALRSKKSLQQSTFCDTISRQASPVESHGVLLIDTRFGQSVLHTMLNIESNNGLQDLLIEDDDLDSSIRNTVSIKFKRKRIRSIDVLDVSSRINNTSLPNLKLITAGETNTQKQLQFDYDKLNAILNILRPRFEFIFLDIPPILSSAAGAQISSLCDGVVLVVQAHKTRWQAINQAKNELERAEANIVGCMLNRVQSYLPAWTCGIL